MSIPCVDTLSIPPSNLAFRPLILQAGITGRIPHALLQRLVLQKKSVHVNATVKEENWQELKFLAPVGLIWSNPRFSSASIGEKNDRS